MVQEQQTPRITLPVDEPTPPAGAPPSVAIRGVSLSAVTEAGCVEHVVRESLAGRGGWVCTPNLHMIRMIEHDPALQALVGRAQLRVADGMPLIWLSRIQQTPLPERVCGSNLVFSLSGAAAGAGLSVFLLGGANRSAVQAAEVLLRQYPNLRVAGTYKPPMGFEQVPRERQRIVEALERSKPDIVYVGLGFPKQSWLIDDLRSRLPESWWIGVGVSFSFVSGEIRRAPEWAQRAGLEWVHRLMQEPRRLIRRYLIDDIPYALGVLGVAMVRRLRSSRGRAGR